MATKKTGISRDLIIHPGETIADILADRGISQSELAARTGVSPAYVSNVISGKKNISANFAQALEYALGVSKTFWLNLQANYDAELLEYNKENSITEEERTVRRKSLTEIVKFLRETGKLPKKQSINESIISLRNIFQVSNLSNLRNVIPAGVFRMSTATSVDPYTLGAWIRLCQILSDSRHISTTFDINSIDQICSSLKDVMTNPEANTIIDIRNILGKYGVDFSVVHHFRGAPVQGYISKKKDGTYHMVLTIRGSFADIFWFSLFHELGHIVNGDMNNPGIFIDYGTDQEMERAADEFAGNALLDPEQYRKFVNYGKFDIDSIKRFAETQKVAPYIVIGRLQRENRIGYNQFSKYKARFKWADSAK